jgi:hypothetical protein
MPSDPRYNVERKVYNEIMNKHPGMIVKCVDVADVIVGVDPYSSGVTYSNFMMEEGQERVKAYYTGNHKRLVSIKNNFNPQNLFNVNQNIKPTV